MSDSPPAIPLVILTGFLGAGKTTVLNRVLAAQHHRRVAVVVNELGRIDIDAALIRARTGDVLELSGGCVCHQIGVQRELWSALEDVVRRARPDVVVLETTGIAEPNAILAGLEELATSGDEGTRPAVRAAAVATIVDAEAGARQLERHEEARDQVRAADRILLSKIDLLSDGPDAPARISALHRRLHDLNASAERSAFPAGPAGDASVVSWLLQPGRVRRGAPARAAHRHEHGGHQPHQLSAASYVDDVPLVGDALLLVCAAFGDRLVRAKGHIHLANEPRRGFLERAGDHTRLVLGAPWGQERPATRLVLIGEGLDDASVQRQLWACRAPARPAGSSPPRDA